MLGIISGRISHQVGEDYLQRKKLQLDSLFDSLTLSISAVKWYNNKILPSCNWSKVKS